MDDQSAVERLKRGDLGGLEILVRRYQVQAMRAAYLVTRDRQLAEDLVQAAFLRAYERIGQLKADRPFGPWFLRSVVNDAVKAAARRERLVSLNQVSPEDDLALAELIADPAPGPETQWEQAEICQIVHAALGQLTPRQRAVIALRYFLGLSEAAIAARTGSPLGTVKCQLHRARARLRGLLASLWDRHVDGTAPART